MLENAKLCIEMQIVEGVTRTKIEGCSAADTYSLESPGQTLQSGLRAPTQRYLVRFPASLPEASGLVTLTTIYTPLHPVVQSQSTNPI